jgi:hypothetical protein
MTAATMLPYADLVVRDPIGDLWELPSFLGNVMRVNELLAARKPTYPVGLMLRERPFIPTARALWMTLFVVPSSPPIEMIS